MIQFLIIKHIKFSHHQKILIIEKQIVHYEEECFSEVINFLDNLECEYHIKRILSSHEK